MVRRPDPGRRSPAGLLRAALPLLTAVALLPACGTRPGGGILLGDAARGRAVFHGRGRCGECHRLEGRGSPVRGPSFDAHWASGPALAERLRERPRPPEYPERVPGDAWLLRSLLEPGRDQLEGFAGPMPAARGPLLRLSRQDLADLLVLLNPGPPARWIPDLPAPGPNPWELLEGGDPQRGEAWFFRPDDSACSGCHVLRLPRLEPRYHPAFWREGSLVGPDLTRVALLLTPEEVMDAILQPHAARTPGFRDVVLETEGERILAGLLLADGEPGVLLLEATPAGPEYRWVERDSIASLELAERSRMTHVFAELLDPGQLLDLLAFLRQVARESRQLGLAGRPGCPWGARDPVRALYDGRWPAEARPELLQLLPGLPVEEHGSATPRESCPETP